jgi:heavy metal sensor kinase
MWYVGVLAAMLLVFIAGTSFVLYFQLFHQLTRFAVQDIETVEGLLSFQHGGPLSLNENYHNHPESRYVLERFLEVITPDGRVIYRNERLGNNFLDGAPFAGEGVNGYSERSSRLQDGARVILVSRRHNLQGHTIIIRLAYDEAAIWSRMDEFLTAAVTALPVLLGLAALFGYQLARRALSPLQAMAQRAEHITAERLDQRLPIDNSQDELGHLAAAFNVVLDRLQQSFDQLRRFTADASHELRTPLAAIRSVGEVGLQNSRSADAYRDTIGSMLEEVGRLTNLVEALLTVSGAEAGQVQIAFSLFSPLELTREVVSLVRVLAEERHQEMLISGEESLKVRGDRLLLRQALINVLQNAVRHSPEGGRISVFVGVLACGRATVRISDSGPGIPVEHRAKIFDRFYRVDSARTRVTGGVGLGLSIAKWAMQAQGGQIRVEDSVEGATFSIELPVAEPLN